MSATKPKSPSALPALIRAFTLIEVLVVVGIIALLIAILVPALFHAKLSAKIASTRATLSSIRTGLASYYTDFNSYPDSHPASIATGTYGGGFNIIPPGRGPALLAQALMGYLPGTLDGAGPDSSQAAYASDPQWGFRTRQSIINGVPMGKTYGPYGPDAPAAYKVNDTNALTDPTKPHDQSFYDSFGGEILYFRSQKLPAPNDPTVIFNTSNGPPGAPAAPFPLFYSDDFLTKSPSSTVADLPSGSLGPARKTPTVANVASATPPYDPFFTLVAGQKNTGATNLITSYPGPILGADSYLLISAGPDGSDPVNGGYFTADDIVMSDH